MSHVASVFPHRAIEGGRITITGTGLLGERASIPDITVSAQQARVVFASPQRLAFLVPSGITDSGPATIAINNGSEGTDGGDGVAPTIEIATPVATGLHQVDSPAVDRDGNLYLTYSGTRGQQVPVSIFRVGANGNRETYSAGITNPTSMAFDRDGRLYVSSRFEGIVYRVIDDGRAETFASDLGIACGLAFGPDGTLYVGDRSGSLFAVDQNGQATAFATLPPSVAAFHLAFDDDALFVTAPTLSPRDPVYRVSLSGEVAVYSEAFGRPQGVAVGPDKALYVVEALAGASGLYRLTSKDSTPELILAGPGLVGVAFDAAGSLIVCTSDTAYRQRPRA